MTKPGMSELTHPRLISFGNFLVAALCANRPRVGGRQWLGRQIAATQIGQGNHDQKDGHTQSGKDVKQRCLLQIDQQKYRNGQRQDPEIRKTT